MRDRSRLQSGVVRGPSTKVLTLLALAAAGAMPSVARAQVDQFEFFFNGATSQGGTNAMGGFAYDATNNDFYTVGFTGTSQALRKISFSGSWSGTVQVGQTDWVNKFLMSSSVVGSGVVLPANYSSASVAGDMLLNPASLTIDGQAYAAGTTGILVDQATVRDTAAGNAIQPQYSKIVYAYDLRKVGDAISGGGRDRNLNGTVDWNDPFTPIVTMQDLQTVQGTTSTTLNIARRHAFSSNGQSIYFNDAGGSFGGIWKVNLTTTGTAALTKVVTALTGTRINSEPWVIHSSVRNLGGGTGDQVLFQGATDIGNLGGISYIVDNGTSNQTPSTLLSAKQLLHFYDYGTASGDVGGITADSSGNIYFMQTGNNGGLFMYDTQGRLAKIFSNAEQRVFDKANGATTFNNNVLDTKVRDKIVSFPSGNATLTQILYNDASGIRAPAGALAYKIGDFNRDNVVDVNDATLMKTRLDLRGATTASIATASPFAETNTANLRYDLNGSFAPTGLIAVSIDWKDVKIFQQFSGMSAGDVDMDFDVDSTDLSTLGANYTFSSKLYTDGNLTSVRFANSDRNDVNFADLVTLAAAWTGAKPPLANVGNIPSFELDRAFAITSGGTISEYTAQGNSNWSTAASWSNATVPNGAGAVASFLTKPYNDVTVTVDSPVTVGQMNFDHFFSYTLSGANAITMNGNGTTAEINTFAASPVISAPVAFSSNTDVTVTYSADTLTLSGGVSGSGTITKKGAGSLVIDTTSGNSTVGVFNGTLGAIIKNGPNKLSVNRMNHAGSLTVNDGRFEVQARTGSPLATNNKPLYVGSLSMGANAILDLNDNDLVVNSGSTFSSIKAKVLAGFGNPNVAGSITSSTSDGSQILALFDNALVSAATWNGVSIAPQAIVGKYTYFGDANIDGQVSGDDYTVIDANLNTTPALGLEWLSGDMNIDGIVTGDDYTVIDANLGLGNGNPLTPSSLSAVPEPAVGIAALALLLPRRRRQPQ